MRSSLILFMFVMACGAPIASTSKSNSDGGKQSHQIDQLVSDDDAGVVSAPDAGPVSSLDSLRIAVAYCASEVILQKVPNYCEVVNNSGGQLKTECDSGMGITWNCERCGDVENNGQNIGHVLMTSDTRFEINKAGVKQGYVCTLNPNGHEFTISMLQ